MSPVIRQNTNEQDRKVATNIPCCAGFSLCAACLQKQHWVSLVLGLHLICIAQMHVSTDWQTVSFANTVQAQSIGLLGDTH